jgi:hypothetical protein
LSTCHSANKAFFQLPNLSTGHSFNWPICQPVLQSTLSVRILSNQFIFANIGRRDLNLQSQDYECVFYRCATAVEQPFSRLGTESNSSFENFSFVNGSYYQLVILSTCKLVIFSLFCQCVILSICHFANLSCCQLVIFPTCHFFNVSFCQFVILSTCHFTNLSFFQLVIFPICHFSNLSFFQLVILPTCHFSNLSFYQLFIFPTCHFTNLSFCR